MYLAVIREEFYKYIKEAQKGKRHIMRYVVRDASGLSGTEAT
jgi:hypothetical protein